MYHRLARTGRYRWWKPVVELALFGVLVVLLWYVVVPASRALFGDDEDGAAGIITLGLALACAMPAAFLAARIVRGRGGAGALLSIEGRIRWRWFATCAVVALVQVALAVVLARCASAPAREAWPGFAQFWPLALAVMIVIPLQSAAEELAFRGLVMQTVGAWVRAPWVAIATSALVFALAHGLSLAGTLSIATFGAVAAWLTYRTRGLEAALALHVLNNVTLFVIAAAAGRGDRWITELNENIRWSATIIDIVLDVLYGLAVATLYSRRRPALRERPIEPLPGLGR